MLICAETHPNMADTAGNGDSVAKMAPENKQPGHSKRAQLYTWGLGKAGQLGTGNPISSAAV